MNDRTRRDEPGRPRDRLAEAYFDRELDEGSRDRLFREVLADPEWAREVAGTQHVINRLRDPVAAPDLTERVLARVDRRRRFASRRVRRLVRGGRLTAVACLLAVVLGVVVIERIAPGALRLAPRSRPISAVVEAGRADAERGARLLADATAPAPPHAAHRGVLLGPLTPGTLEGVRRLPPVSDHTLVVTGGSGAATVRRVPDAAALAWSMEPFSFARASFLGGADSALERSVGDAPRPTPALIRFRGLEWVVGGMFEGSSGGGSPR